MSHSEPVMLDPALPSPTRITLVTTPNKLTMDAQGSHWIGGLGLGNTALGSSGRAIEKLMAENDRLRREMRAEIAKREELQRAVQTQKPKLEGLEADNASLSHIKSMDDDTIKRREQKIADMKSDLESERRRRDAAEQRAAEANKLREEEQEAHRKEVQMEREKARQATAHAEILQTSHQQLSREYRQRIASAKDALQALNQDKAADTQRVVRLDIVSNQMRQETERMRKVHSDLVGTWQRFVQDDGGSAATTVST